MFEIQQVIESTLMTRFSYLLSMAQSPISINQDQLIDSYKTPPHSIESEQSVLGGLMLDNHAWEKVADIITDVDF